MQLATHIPNPESVAKFAVEDASEATQSRYSEYKIIRRNGAVVGFEPSKISIALTKAFIAVNGGQGAASARVREVVATLTDTVVAALMRRQPSGGTFHIEDIQDQVELALMRSGEHEVARAYVLYREQRSQERAKQREAHAAAIPARTDDQRYGQRQDAPARSGESQGAGAGVVRRPGPRGRSGGDHAGHVERPVRRRAGR